jgi:predicted component of type VI protein secretion system
VLEQIEGIDYIPDILLTSQCQPGESHCVAAAPIWNQEGDITELELAAHHLPTARLNPNQIVIAPNSDFVAVQLTVNITRAANAVQDRDTLQRQVKKILRDFLHPLHDGPGPTTPNRTEMRLSNLQQVITNASGVQQLNAITLQTDSSRLLYQDNQVDGVFTEATEVIDLQLKVAVTEQ